MIKMKKFLILALAALIAMGIFQVTWAAKPKPIEVIFSEFDDPNVYKEAFWKEFLGNFTAENPGIVVRRIHNNDNDIRTNWQNQVVTGSGPDLTFAPHDSIGLFAESGTALELDKFFNKTFYSQFDTKIVNDYKYKGKIYGIPYRHGNAVMLIYNKKLIAQAPKTMNELIEKAKQLTKGTEQYGLVYDMVEPFFVMGFLGGYGGQVFDAKGNITLNTEAMKKMMKLVYDFKFTYKITPKEANSDVANGLFREGKAAMAICGPWLFPQLDAAKIDYGMAILPKIDGAGYPAPYSGAKVIILNPNLVNNKKKTDAVKKFVTYMNSPSVQLKYAKMVSEIPTNRKALEDTYVKNDPKVKALSEQLTKAVPMPSRPEMRCIWDAMKSTMALVMGGKLKPEDAPKAMQEEAEKLKKNMLGQ